MMRVVDIILAVTFGPAIALLLSAHDLDGYVLGGLLSVVIHQWLKPGTPTRQARHYIVADRVAGPGTVMGWRVHGPRAPLTGRWSALQSLAIQKRREWDGEQ